MYEQVNNKINEIIDLFQKNNDIKEMIKLKNELLKDDDIKSKLMEYEKLLANPYKISALNSKLLIVGFPPSDVLSSNFIIFFPNV